MLFRSWIAATEEDPRRFVRPNLVPPRDRKLDVLDEVFVVVNRLLERENAKALRGEIRIRVGLSKETVFEQNDGAVEHFGEVTRDRTDSQVANICYSIA